MSRGLVVPAVSDRARSPAAAEKISNEANEVSSPLLAYAASGASVLYRVMTEGGSDETVFVEIG